MHIPEATRSSFPHWMRVAASRHISEEIEELRGALSRDYLSNEERHLLYMREEELGLAPEYAFKP